jgi:hypothetical protein
MSSGLAKEQGPQAACTITVPAIAKHHKATTTMQFC